MQFTVENLANRNRLKFDSDQFKQLIGLINQNSKFKSQLNQIKAGVAAFSKPINFLTKSHFAFSKPSYHALIAFLARVQTVFVKQST